MKLDGISFSSNTLSHVILQRRCFFRFAILSFSLFFLSLFSSPYLEIIVCFALRSLGTSTLFDILWVCVYFPCWWFSFWPLLLSFRMYVFFCFILPSLVPCLASLRRLFAVGCSLNFCVKCFLFPAIIILPNIRTRACQSFIEKFHLDGRPTLPPPNTHHFCNNFSILRNRFKDFNYNRPPFCSLQSIYGGFLFFFLRTFFCDAQRKKPYFMYISEISGAKPLRAKALHTR